LHSLSYFNLSYVAVKNGLSLFLKALPCWGGLGGEVFNKNVFNL